MRYSDDCRIFVRDRRSGEEALNTIADICQNRLNLRLNKEKSFVAKATEIDYFGKILKPGPGGLVIAKKDRKPGSWYSEWMPFALSFSGGTYHIREDGILSAKGRTILFENESRSDYLPVEQISGINVFGNTIFDKSFFGLMNQRHIDVVMFDQNGKYIGTFFPAESSSDMSLVIKQIQIYSDDRKRTAFAASITIAGIKNMMAAIRYYHKQNPSVRFELALQAMKDQIRSIRNAKTVNAVMSAEARCRQEYYDCFTDFIYNDRFSFTSRTRRPPKDPVNAIMSSAMFICTTGFLP